MNVNFSSVNACGGDCTECTHFTEGECKGCNKNSGKCVKLWENGCEICRCCKEHGVKFCGLCEKFPCGWLAARLSEWDGGAVSHIAELAAEYRRRETEFSAHLPQLWESIGTHGVMTLSACADSRVTSRPMSVVVIGGRFYCQTDEGYLKCRQIKENSNVALCCDNFSIEGVCEIIGTPDQNKHFLSAMQEHFTSAAERWSSLPTECVLEVMPALIYSWVYENDTPYIEYWDFNNLTYRKERK